MRKQKKMAAEYDGKCYHVSTSVAPLKAAGLVQLGAERLQTGDFMTNNLLMIQDSGSATQQQRWAANATHLLRNRSTLLVKSAVEFYLSLAVDAFLNHDFVNSASFYATYLYLSAAIKAERVEYFLQGTLSVIYEGDPGLGDFTTPWGTTYVGYPKSWSSEQVAGMVIQLYQKIMVLIRGEEELLRLMMSNPDVTCRCLNVEDPYHPDFGKEISMANIFDVKMSKKSNAYIIDCASCGRPPRADEKEFKACGRCKRVRYCSKICQKADWPNHKAKCERKTADWWGKTPRVGKKARNAAGFA